MTNLSKVSGSPTTWTMSISPWLEPSGTPRPSPVVLALNLLHSGGGEQQVLVRSSLGVWSTEEERWRMEGEEEVSYA